MTWRDQYQHGSFRGAAFRTEAHELSGGRRVATFEFPGRDQPVTEDLGRRARKFSIDCHVVGADYRVGRDALIDALEASGAGLLIHPWHGQMMVVVEDFTSSEDQAGGICQFSISFGEAGQAVSAPVAAPSGQAAAIAADAHAVAAPASFLKRFSIDGVAGFVEQSASNLITGMVEVSKIAAGLQGGFGPALRAFDAGLRYLPGNVSSLLRSPLNLAHAMIGLVGAVSLLGGGARSRILSLTQMIDWTPADPLFPEITVSRQREADNRDALLWLFRSAAASELVRTASAATYASYEDAVATRDLVAGRLDVLAMAAADLGDDERAESFDGLRRALVRDMAARVPTLARLFEIETMATEPALVIANRVYGSSGVEATAAEIVARNRLPHPGFVPGGRAIELLTTAEAA